MAGTRKKVNPNTTVNETPITPADDQVTVKIFDSFYDFDKLPQDIQKMFVLQNDIRRDLAFRHAMADAALSYIKNAMEDKIKTVPTIER